MEEYEIVYDWCNGETEEHNLTERFVGDWLELQEHIKKMRQNGCYNIDATSLCQG